MTHATEQAFYHNNGKACSESPLPECNIGTEIQCKQKPCYDSAEIPERLLFCGNGIKDKLRHNSTGNAHKDHPKCIRTKQDHRSDSCRKQSDNHIRHNETA